MRKNGSALDSVLHAKDEDRGHDRILRATFWAVQDRVPLRGGGGDSRAGLGLAPVALGALAAPPQNHNDAR